MGYNYGVLNIVHPRFPQEAIPRGVHGENIHQNHPYCYYTNMTTHHHTRIPPHPNHHIPPPIYPSITPHQVCLCPYYTSNPMYAPYIVPQYPHILSLGYLHTKYSRPPYYMFPPHSYNNMSEYRRKMRNRRSNESKRKIIYSISIT